MKLHIKQPCKTGWSFLVHFHVERQQIKLDHLFNARLKFNMNSFFFLQLSNVYKCSRVEIMVVNGLVQKNNKIKSWRETKTKPSILKSKSPGNDAGWIWTLSDRGRPSRAEDPALKPWPIRSRSGLLETVAKTWLERKKKKKKDVLQGPPQSQQREERLGSSQTISGQ